MLKMIRLFAALMFVFSVVGFYSCSAPKAISTITGTNYDKRKDMTTYMVLPYGSVHMPGMWTEDSYNSKSRQQFFKSKGPATLSVAIGAANKMEFNTSGLKGYKFAKAYYEWESQYQREQLHQQVELIKDDSVNKYILWRVHSDNVNTFQLFAGTDCDCAGGAFKSLTVSGKGMTNEELVQLLESVYLNKGE